MGNLYKNIIDIYWPFLQIVIIHLFIPIAFIQSPLFKYLLYHFDLVIDLKNPSNTQINTELLLEYNKKWYLRYIMRKLLQVRLFMAYKRAISSGCTKVWNQFINDRYVVGRKLVNYYYKTKKPQETSTNDEISE